MRPLSVQNPHLRMLLLNSEIPPAYHVDFMPCAPNRVAVSGQLLCDRRGKTLSARRLMIRPFARRSATACSKITFLAFSNPSPRTAASKAGHPPQYFEGLRESRPLRHRLSECDHVGTQRRHHVIEVQAQPRQNPCRELMLGDGTYKTREIPLSIRMIRTAPQSSGDVQLPGGRRSGSVLLA